MENTFFIAGIFLTLILLYAAFALPFAALQIIVETIFLNRNNHFSKAIKLFIDNDYSDNGIFSEILMNPMISQPINLTNKAEKHFFSILFRKNKKIINSNVSSKELANSLIFVLRFREIKQDIDQAKIEDYIHNQWSKIDALSTLTFRNNSENTDWLKLKDLTSVEIDKIHNKFISKNIAFHSALEEIRGVFNEIKNYLALVGQFDQNSPQLTTVLLNLSQILNSNESDANLKETVLKSVSSRFVSKKLAQNISCITQDIFEESLGFNENLEKLAESISLWFDRCLTVESKMYERKRKFLAIFLGFLVAVSVNIDTLHIIGDSYKYNNSTIFYSKDLYLTLASKITDVSNYTSLSENLAGIQDALGEVNYWSPNIPFGYSEIIVQRQLEAERSWAIPFIPRRIIGWIISAVALSMGASFWFNLIDKMRLR